MKTNLLLMAVGFTVLTACSNQEDTNKETQHFPVAASIRGTICQEKNLRMANDAWENGDAIGISGISGSVAYTNIKYNFSSGTVFTPEAGSSIYYIDGQEVTFSAYHPFSTAGETLNVNVSDQTGSKQFDYLYATATGSAQSPNLDFGFYHKMAKVVLTFKPGTGFAEDKVFSGCTVHFASLHAAGTFNTQTGVAIADANGTAGLNFTDGNQVIANGNIYSFILLPETVTGGVALSLTLDGTTYEGAILKSKDAADLSLTAGKVYEYNVTVNCTGLTVSASNIYGWDSTPGSQDVELNM